MTSKERIKQFIDFKRLDYYPFEMKAGLSNGALKKTTGVSSTSLEKIHNAFPELNMDWIITGRGEMIITAQPAAHILNDSGEELQIANWKEKYYDLMERYTSLLEQLNKLKNTG